MRLRLWPYLAMALWVSLVAGEAASPACASAKVFFYAIATEDGGLIKYDPDANLIVQVQPNLGQPYINYRNTDDDNFGPSRILDIARDRIVSITNVGPGVVLLNLRARTAREIDVQGPDLMDELRHLVYLRQGSRFYVFWIRRSSTNPTGPAEPVLAAVDLDGRVLATTPAPIADPLGFSQAHPDGRTFYVFNEPNEILRVDGETLAVRERHDVSAFYRPGAARRAVYEVRDGRALLLEWEGTRDDRLDPVTLFTVDLGARTASSRITTGLGEAYVRLVPGGRTIVLQEAFGPHSVTGAGTLHFYDVATGNKLGTVTFPAKEGAIPLAFHPDGRRLFIHVRGTDPATQEPAARLVIVDVVARSVLVDRPFEPIGMAVDFVDEP